MASITPPNFTPLQPVHSLILDELIASAPLSVLTLCSSVHKRALSILYADIYSSPAVFKGLQSNEGYERTVESLKSTKTIRVRDFTSIDTLYSLSGPEREQPPAPSPSSPGNSAHPYPRRYVNLFPNLERLELGFPALQTTYHEYLEVLESSNPAAEEDETRPLNFLARRISKQLPNGVKEITFHLDNDRADYWYEIDQHLLFQRPREAVILLKGTVKTADEVAQSNATFGRLGEELPTEWPNAERLTVFVDTDEPLDRSDSEQVQRYVVPMSKALANYSQGLAWRINLGQEKRMLGDEDDVEMRLVDHVQIHMPHVARVLEQMTEDGRKQVDGLVRDGRLVVGEFEESMVDGLGLMK
ncbi:hypothetical protein I350_00057 [Cryptococcus amylolentus CBS 6273]|uniref:Uncharacterized protein n=1 Tax=Cryptococcus amylolentus CBS 6273 TaxID=1296118 RepID=A0A1E3KG58_9TREE|nr:hypothetical protein I350_00057 [Cryptococcus amylolentus CBS 6273]